ncbi:MAG: Uma2 family endonuclease [bacterium]|nr:Uma2 family endonuclease [bacterium]
MSEARVTSGLMPAITQAELLRLDAEERWIEVEDGEIIEVENNVPLIHVLIIQNLHLLFVAYLKNHRLGRVFTDGARFILKGTPNRVERARKPDFAFVRRERIADDFDWTGDFPGAPDLAVEVMSPGQTNAIISKRLAHYFEAGALEVWVIYPWHKTLWQYRRDQEAPAIYGEGDAVDTSALFPGFALNVNDIFSVDGELA